MQKDGSLKKMVEALKLQEALLKKALQGMDLVFETINEIQKEKRFISPKIVDDSPEESYLQRQISQIERLMERIIHIKSNGPYIEISFRRDPEKRPLWLRIGITKLNHYFSQNVLLRISRSTLVNPNYVLSISKKNIRTTK